MKVAVSGVEQDMGKTTRRLEDASLEECLVCIQASAAIARHLAGSVQLSGSSEDANDLRFIAQQIDRSVERVRELVTVSPAP